MKLLTQLDNTLNTLVRQYEKKERKSDKTLKKLPSTWDEIEEQDRIIYQFLINEGYIEKNLKPTTKGIVFSKQYGYRGKQSIVWFTRLGNIILACGAIATIFIAFFEAVKFFERKQKFCYSSIGYQNYNPSIDISDKIQYITFLQNTPQLLNKQQ